MYETFNDGSDFQKDYPQVSWRCLVRGALKFIILYFIVLRRNEFNEPMDGIVYGVTVSLGFCYI